MKLFTPLLLFLLLSTAVPSTGMAQDVITIEPLFEYPTAPEELPTINEKSDYLVEHFWDRMDFKSKSTVDQNALNDAFRVYAVPIRWAEKKKALASVDKLIEKISKNPSLLIQFTKAAEVNLFSDRADAWIDEAYVPFLRAIVKNKKIGDNRKKRYAAQLEVIENTMTGKTAPQFTFKTREGKEATYMPMSTSTLIIFGDPSLSEWRMSRPRLLSNTAFTEAVDKGKINVLYIVTSEDGDWKKEVANYPATWTVGKSEDVDRIFDIRTNPSIYVIGNDGKIIMKNAPLAEAVRELTKN